MMRSNQSAPATAAARPKVTRDDPEAERYSQGRSAGLVWARDYATPEELRYVVENFHPSRGGYFDNPHWRGFIAGAEEVLDDGLRCSNGRRQGPHTPHPTSVPHVVPTEEVSPV
jgi:hypothetical protein